MAERESPARREVHAVLRYGLAVASVAAALLTTLALGPTIFEGPAFFLAVVVSAWFGGGRPGLLATVLATLALAYFVLPPIYSLRVDPPNRIPLLMFALAAVLVSWLGAVTRRTLAQLRGARDELETRVQERTADLTATNEKLRAEISERQRVEATLTEHAALLDLTHDSVFAKDMRDVITYWNRGARELYGWDRDETVGRTAHDLLQTILPVPLADINRALLATGRWEGQLVHTRRDGSKVVVASRWALQRDEHGNPTTILETTNDISEQRRAQEALRESERRYRNIFEAVGVSIWEEDFSEVQAAIEDLKARGVRDFREYIAAHPEFVRRAILMVKITDVNDATVRLFAAKNKAELLTSPERVFLPETEEVFRGELIAVAEGRTYFEAETTLQTLDGQPLTVLFTITFPEPPARLERVLVTITDITQRKRAQDALQKTEAELAHVTRVTTLGELAASIAHEVNQPLAAIVADAEASLNWLALPNPDLDRVHDAIAAIVKDGHRAAEVIQRIRQLAAKTEPRKDPLDVNDVVRDVLSVVRSELHRHEVKLNLELASGLPPVLGDRVQLQQVLLNLMMNGIEAMVGVEDRPRELLIRCKTYEPGAIVVAVRDCGIGFDPQGAHRMFDSFYTTKPHGLGMGLSISRSIIEAHGGRLGATANDDHGVTFEFTLPT